MIYKVKGLLIETRPLPNGFVDVYIKRQRKWVWDSFVKAADFKFFYLEKHEEEQDSFDDYSEAS